MHFRMRLQKLVLLFVTIFFVGAFFLQATTVKAQVKLDITRGQFQKLILAIPDLQVVGNANPQKAQKIQKIIENNLAGTGFFKIVASGQMPRPTISFNERPNMSLWQGADIQALLVARVVEQGSIEFRLWDIYAQEQLMALRYSASSKDWRRLAHKVADAVYEKITGYPGYFDTQITFIEEWGKKTNRKKRLAIMDQDGANVRYLTDGRGYVMTPRYNPRRHEIAYVNLTRAQTTIYVIDVMSGKRRIVSSFQGSAFSPVFSPDGQSMVLGIIRNGDADLYRLDLHSKKMRRLTNTPGIDVSPSFSPDGSKIVFNSDRGGSQQLYIMNVDGTNPKRISFGRGRYATPAWSPKGDKIAFTKMQGGRFSIGIMNIDGSNERIVSSSFADEAPSWAPNGQALVFFRQSPGSVGASHLYKVDLIGHIQARKIATPGFASDPAWSPMMP